VPRFRRIRQDVTGSVLPRLISRLKSAHLAAPARISLVQADLAGREPRAASTAWRRRQFADSRVAYEINAHACSERRAGWCVSVRQVSVYNGLLCLSTLTSKDCGGI